MSRGRGLLALAVLALLAPACGGREEAAPRLRLATTTSVRDTGLLDVLLPAFREETGVEVQALAVGSGQALRLAERGDADVVIAHSRAAEDAFVAAGHGLEPRDLWWNRFVVYGPASDPARAAGDDAAAALRRIRDAGATFVSRGDASGTHEREKALWGGEVPRWPGYLESGQGMSETLRIAEEKQAYVLSDEGTFLRVRARTTLVPLVAKDASLRNPYRVVVVRERDGRAAAHAASRRFGDWLVGPRARALVRSFVLEGRRAFFLPDEPPAGP